MNMKKKRKGIVRFCWMLCMMMSVGMPVFAAGEPALVSGTRSLLAAGTAIITGLVAAIGIWKASVVGIKWINASAEERPKYQKELVLVIVAVIVTLTIGGTITWIVGFYGA